jgi:hypothetical protein
METKTETVRLKLAIPETLLNKIHQEIKGSTIEEKLIKCIYAGYLPSRLCGHCRKPITQVSNIVCANCGATFHASCVSKLADSCPNCGYKE